MNHAHVHPRGRKRGRLALSAILALALLGSACAGDDSSTETAGEPSPDGEASADGEENSNSEWEEIVAAAQEEGVVTIYSGQGADQLADFAAAFEEEYGIRADFTRGIESDLIPRVEAEAETGGVADIYFASDLVWVREANERGLFVEPVGPNLRENDAYDWDARAPEGTYFEASAAVLTFAWNTDLHPGGIQDYPDFLDPQLANGQIGVVDPVAPSLVDFYFFLEENYGEDFVEDLAAQSPRIYPSALPMLEALIAGEIAAATFVVPPQTQVEEGAPIDFAFPETVMGYRYNGLLLESAPNPNAAQLVADFMLSERGQELIARDFASAIPDVPGTIAYIEDVREQDPEKLTLDAVRDYQQRWSSLFR